MSTSLIAAFLVVHGLIHAIGLATAFALVVIAVVAASRIPDVAH